MDANSITHVFGIHFYTIIDIFLSHGISILLASMQSIVTRLYVEILSSLHRQTSIVYDDADLVNSPDTLFRASL